MHISSSKQAAARVHAIGMLLLTQELQNSSRKAAMNHLMPLRGEKKHPGARLNKRKKPLVTLGDPSVFSASFYQRSPTPHNRVVSLVLDWPNFQLL